MQRQTIFGIRILQDSGPAVSVDHWRSLYYFNLYRLALAVFFVSTALGGTPVVSFGRHNPQLFLVTAVAYGLIAAVSLYTITKGRPRFRLQAQLQIFADILCLLIFMHASGGTESGLGLLLIVSVAAAGVAMGGRMAIFFAAFATVALMVEFAIAETLLHVGRRSPTQLGLLGIGLFVTAFLLYGLVGRILRAETLAERRGLDLANLEEVNRVIIERMGTGVIATDGEGRIRVTNETACKLLELQYSAQTHPSLIDAAPDLADGYREFRRNGLALERLVTVAETGRELVVRFVPLGGSNTCLIYLDDSGKLAQQTQQLRLAALGRLSAGVAHEIRNPLGAISHAGQLLDESRKLDGDDRRLLQIIREQCRRMNTLVENVMQLGRRESPERRQLDLYHWLQEFVTNYCEASGLPREKLVLAGERVRASVNPEQLHQVVSNLCDNALRHSNVHGIQTPVELSSGVDHRGRAYLDIVDRGPGIAAEHRDRIFEPFFTTESRGTGLGLYIARELCSANDADLSYTPAETGGSRFRIRFPSETALPVAREA